MDEPDGSPFASPPRAATQWLLTVLLAFIVNEMSEVFDMSRPVTLGAFAGVVVVQLAFYRYQGRREVRRRGGQLSALFSMIATTFPIFVLVGTVVAAASLRAGVKLTQVTIWLFPAWSYELVAYGVAVALLIAFCLFKRDAALILATAFGLAIGTATALVILRGHENGLGVSLVGWTLSMGIAGAVFALLRASDASRAGQALFRRRE